MSSHNKEMDKKVKKMSAFNKVLKGELYDRDSKAKERKGFSKK